jgi:hypothetical protein
MCGMLPTHLENHKEFAVDAKHRQQIERARGLLAGRKGCKFFDSYRHRSGRTRRH